MQLLIIALGYIRFRPGHVYVWELRQLHDGFLNINHIGVTWGICHSITRKYIELQIV